METLDIVISVFIVLLSVAPVPALIATAYLWTVYRRDPARPRSWLIRLFASSATVVTGSVCYVAFISLWRLLGFGQLPEVLVLFLAVDLFVLATVPPIKAFYVYRASHGGSRPTVPKAPPR